MNLQSWIMIIAIFVLMVLPQMGERKYTGKKIIYSVAIIVYLCYEYVKMPTTIVGVEWIIAMAILGFIFGVFMLKSMKFRVENNEKYVTSGTTYLIIWVIGLGWKILLTEYMTKVNPVGSYEFMINHGISVNIISTMFMAFTIMMIIVKIIGTYLILDIKAKRAVVR